MLGDLQHKGHTYTLIYTGRLHGIVQRVSNPYLPVWELRDVMNKITDPIRVSSDVLTPTSSISEISFIELQVRFRRTLLAAIMILSLSAGTSASLSTQVRAVRRHCTNPFLALTSTVIGLGTSPSLRTQDLGVPLELLHQFILAANVH
jgi:hypothetical protein